VSYKEKACRFWTTTDILYFMVAGDVWQFYITCCSCSPCMQLRRHICIMRGYYKITTTCWAEHFMPLSWSRLIWPQSNSSFFFFFSLFPLLIKELSGSFLRHWHTLQLQQEASVPACKCSPPSSSCEGGCEARCLPSRAQLTSPSHSLPFQAHVSCSSGKFLSTGGKALWCIDPSPVTCTQASPPTARGCPLLLLAWGCPWPPLVLDNLLGEMALDPQG